MKRQNFKSFLVISVILILLVRLFLIGYIPLLDKTESRYAEIARLMYVTNNWTVLQIDYGIPFWAKPPLSTWLSAISFKLFGINEFAARLPIYLLSLATIALVYIATKKNKKTIFFAAFILLTIPEFLLHTGVVSTDVSLGFSVALAMISFYKALQEKSNKIWSYLFFVGIGLGLLAKGPIVIILTGPPIFLWLMSQKKVFKTIFKKINWILGIILVAIIAIPWYYFAEQKSPGFIDYFIIGEHFKRFFESGWQGDMYGKPKTQPLGMIWVFLFIVAFPWVQVIIHSLIKNWKEIINNTWLRYLLFWILWTPIFFTFSRNLMHTYTIPIMVPIALFIINQWDSYKKKRRLVITASIFPSLVIIATIIALLKPSLMSNLGSDKDLIVRNVAKEDQNKLFYWGEKSYSSQFYNGAKVNALKTKKELDAVLLQNQEFYLIVPKKAKKIMLDLSLQKLVLKDSNKKRLLFKHSIN